MRRTTHGPTARTTRRLLTTIGLCGLMLVAGLTVATSASAATDPQLDAGIVRSVNAIRAAHGLRALTVNYQLSRRADMQTRLILSHNQLKAQFPGVADIVTCLASQGYWAQAAAVTVGWSGSQSLVLRQPAYMATHSPSKASLLSSGYTSIGVAVRPSANHDRYVVTIVYARPMTTAQL
ncbi:MAG: CAP domain-containing protein, partial [Jatrophihabitantaceae bacterium]